MITDQENEQVLSFMPPELKAQWQAYREWRLAMYRAGAPLPMGGVIAINSNSILLDEINRVQYSISKDLNVPIENVKVDIFADPNGRPTPIFNVFRPKDWLPPDFPKGLINEEDLQKIADTYIEAYIKTAYELMVKRLNTRKAHIYEVRHDLQPKRVIDGRAQ